MVNIYNIFNSAAYIVILLSVFQGCGIVIGDIPIVPVAVAQMILAILFFLRILLQGKITTTNVKMRISFWLFIFVVYAILTAIILPNVFQGHLVYNPRTGMDSQEINSLMFSISNFGQIVYLIFNSIFFLVVFYSSKSKEMLNVLLYSGLIILFFAFYQKISQLTNIWYPYEFINSNNLYYQGYDQILNGVNRVSSTFTEPSIAGGALGTFFTYYLFCVYNNLRDIKSVFLLLLYLIGVLLTTSSIGYLQVAFSILLLTLYTAKGSKKTFSFIILTVIVAIFSLYYYDIIKEVIIYKSDSLSFTIRFATDYYAIKILFSTFGLGVGMGSNRPSSFITYLLSNMGIIGTCLYAIFIWQIIKYGLIKKNPSIKQKALMMALLSCLFGKVLGIPDINAWNYWAILACTANYCLNADPNNS